MAMLKDEKKKLIIDIFDNRVLFEKEVLGVHSSSDRIEVMRILSKKLIRGALKYELNFLYMHDLHDFKFSLIINLLFREFANEWVSFAQEELYFSREDSLSEIQDKKRVTFIYSLVQYYFLKHKKFFFQEITDTFVELIDTVTDTQNPTPLVENVLSSKLMRNKNVLVMQNFAQLLSRVKAAHNIKDLKLSKIQVEISEVINTIEYAELDVKDREKYQKSLNIKEEESHKIAQDSLSNYDEALQNLKIIMVNNMLKMPIS